MITTLKSIAEENRDGLVYVGKTKETKLVFDYVTDWFKHPKYGAVRGTTIRKPNKLRTGLVLAWIWALSVLLLNTI